WKGELMVDHSLTPTLDIFCHRLRQAAAEAAGAPLVTLHSAGAHAPVSPDGAGRQIGAMAIRLAEEIEALYVYGDYARNFNVPTNLDLTLRERIVLFDFSHVPERRRPLFYYAALAGINHQVRRRPRKRVIIVDE